MPDEKKYSPEAVANNILWMARREDRAVTPMQLMKLVYISYGWALAMLDRKLFDDPIEAWQYGPVIPRLYGTFQRYGGGAIEGFASRAVHSEKTGDIIDTEHPVVDPTDKEAISIIAAVWKNYKEMDGWKLSELTHQEYGAWSKAFEKGKGTRLNDEDIKIRSLEGISKKYAQKACH
jgi:uncharacterized phage-associated protein